MGKLVARAHDKRVKGITGIELMCCGIEVQLALYCFGLIFSGWFLFRPIFESVSDLTISKFQFFHGAMDQRSVFFLNPVLEFPVRHADYNAVIRNVAEPRGAQPCLVALCVNLSLQIAEDLLPGIHGDSTGG